MADSTDYVVLKEADKTPEAIEEAISKGQRVWVEVGTTAGDNNKDAIAKATAAWSDEQKRGNYAAPSARNFPVIPRDITTKVVDEFGEPSTAGTRSRRPSGGSAKAEGKAAAGAAA